MASNSAIMRTAATVKEVLGSVVGVSNEDLQRFQVPVVQPRHGSGYHITAHTSMTVIFCWSGMLAVIPRLSRKRLNRYMALQVQTTDLGDYSYVRLSLDGNVHAFGLVSQRPDVLYSPADEGLKWVIRASDVYLAVGMHVELT
jgi:hypothetical protein